LGPNLTEEEARAIVRQGEEAAVFALLALAKLLAEQLTQAAGTSNQTPSTPSGMQPPYQKPATKTRGKKKPGRKNGHPGSRRAAPTRIDQHAEHRAEECPHCRGPVHRCAETRVRYIEDIPDDLYSQVTKHTIHRDWCPRCKKKVEPVVTEALPNATLGNRVLILSAWLHYGVGTTLGQIVDVFNFHLVLKVTPGAEWPDFAKKLRRLIMDAIRLRRRRGELAPEAYASRRKCIAQRLQKLIDAPWTDKQSKRLIKRFRRHQNELFTFLDQPDVPFDNNLAERSIRPAVILRKNHAPA